MVELVDTLDLGSSAFGRAGSSPVSGNYRISLMENLINISYIY